MQTDTHYTERLRDEIKVNILKPGEEIFMSVTERIRKIEGQWQRVHVPISSKQNKIF